MIVNWLKGKKVSSGTVKVSKQIDDKSKVDHLIQEVSEDLRYDMVQLFLKSRWKEILAVLLLAIFLACSYGVWLYAVENKSRRGGEMYSSLKLLGDDDSVIEEFLDLGVFGKGYGLIGRLYAAGLLLKKDNISDAVEVYDEVISSGNIKTIYRHLAILNSVMSRVDTTHEHKDLESLSMQISEIINDDGSLTSLALEVRAVIMIKMERLDDALHDIDFALSNYASIDNPVGVAMMRLELLRKFVVSTIARKSSDL